MATFTVIPESTFDALQVDAGVIMKEFDPENPAVADANLVTATTGGIKISCVPTYSDWGENVDNCPNKMKELMHLDGWDCKLTTTAIGTSPELIKLALGAATETQGVITPRATLAQSDFADLWWVGDKANGGFVAVKIMNALSTGGFSLTTTKNNKGQFDLEISGHVSLSDQSTVPMVFYSIDPTTSSDPATPSDPANP